MVLDNGATYAVQSFYAAVDTKNLSGISGVVVPSYTASVTGCASIGGAHICSTASSIGASSTHVSCTARYVCTRAGCARFRMHVRRLSWSNCWALQGDTAVFDTDSFEAMINAHPARAGGSVIVVLLLPIPRVLLLCERSETVLLLWRYRTVSRILTVDNSGTTTVVLNQYTMADGSHGTAVHMVSGARQSTCLIVLLYHLLHVPTAH